eukprot:4717070-Alexandrium_andersonii.AAC.1
MEDSKRPAEVDSGWSVSGCCIVDGALVMIMAEYADVPRCVACRACGEPSEPLKHLDHCAASLLQKHGACHA